MDQESLEVEEELEVTDSDGGSPVVIQPNPVIPPPKRPSKIPTKPPNMVIDLAKEENEEKMAEEVIEEPPKPKLTALEVSFFFLSYFYKISFPH